MMRTRRWLLVLSITTFAGLAWGTASSFAGESGERAEPVTNRIRPATATVGNEGPARSVPWTSRQTSDPGQPDPPMDWWPFDLQPPFGGLTREDRSRPSAVMPGNASFLVHRGAPAIPSELASARTAEEAGGYFVVHFTRPLTVEDRLELEERGVRTLRYVPRGAWLVQTRGPAAALAKLGGVDGVFRYEPAYKISPRIGRHLHSLEERQRRGDDLLLRLDLFPGAPTIGLAEELGELGARAVSISETESAVGGLLPDGRSRPIVSTHVDLRVPRAQAAELIPALARLERVRWIAERPEYRLASDWTVSGWVYGGSRSAGADLLTVRQPWNNGLHGEGVLLGNVDTGIDFDHTHFADPVSPAHAPESPPTLACPGGGPKNSLKVPYYHLAPPSGELIPACYDQADQLPDFGHGTTTSGIIAADPTAGDNATIDLRSGTAPEAQLWIYDAGPASGTSLALDAAALIAELDAMGAAGVAAVNLSIVSDETNGEYSFLAEILDGAAWGNPSMLPVQAAGNDGDDEWPGDYASIDATGKNILTVGGNLDDVPNDLYSFSSRGPTADGRHKPDLLAPARNSASLPSADPELDETLVLLSSDGDIASGNAGFTYSSEGTSYSCAALTGAAGVVAQYFAAGFYPTGQASAGDGFVAPNHLLKGVAINSAARITGESVLDDARPGKDQGWGRARLNDPLYFSADPDNGDDARRLVVFQGSFPQGPTSCPADAERFTFELFNVEEELKVTLAWTDYPGDHSNPLADQIVNDLDLTVTAPGGAIYLGNVFDDIGTGWSVVGGLPDRLNSVENVWLPGASAPTGTYTVEVCPYAINDGIRQDFSLIVTGGVRAGEKVRLDQTGYSCADTVGLEVDDLDAAGPTVDVLLVGLSSGDSETLTLPGAGRTGLYASTIPTGSTSGAPVADDGLLEVADGETIQVGYAGSSDTAQIECTPAVCYAVDIGTALRHECDHDGFADNGEVLHLYVPLQNEASFTVDGATATLGSTHPAVTVLSGTATYGAIPAGETAYPDSDGSDDPFVISVAGAACDEVAALNLTLVSGQGWTGAGCAASQVDLRLERDPFPLEVWDFDDGSPQGWTHTMAHGTRPAEECDASYIDPWNTFPTTARSHSGSYSMRMGNGSYGVLVDAALVSPPLPIPSGGARLSFRYWMEADIFDDAQVWHGFIVEASADAGASWTRLTPVEGYNALAARDDCAYSFPFASTAPGFLELFGGDGGGTEYAGDTFDQDWTVDLAAYAAQTVQVRFRFGADDYAGGSEGLYVDTVTLEGYQCESANICDDGEPCTTDSCDADAGGCQYEPETDGTGCDDGEACTDTDECTGGVCGGTAVLSCDDGEICTDDRAEDDGDGTCDDLMLDCVHVDNTAPCDDSNACTSDDICAAGSCTAGPTIDCADQNHCTDDSCDPATGCVNAFNTDPCVDPYDCTDSDVCADGLCGGTPNHLFCDNGETCTVGTCDPGAGGAMPDGCLQTPVTDGTTCDDEDVCTEPDTCLEGICGGPVIDCGDGIACTDDLCDAVTGCSNPGIDWDTDGYDLCSDADPVNPDGLPEDCNDQVAEIHPGQLENCFNGQDDDCNDLVDELDPLGCPLSDVSGAVVYYRDSGDVEPSTKVVPGVTMTMVGTASSTSSSDAAGIYGFQDILKGLVSVIPSKTADFGGAISSYDAAKVSQYRVAMIDLTPWQLIAGDVSGNGSVSSYDAALMSQFRVAIIDRFPIAVTKGSDWAFVPDQRDYAPLDSDRTAEDYVAILYGDVSGNWSPPARGSEAVAQHANEEIAQTENNETSTTDSPADGGACRLTLTASRSGPGRNAPTRYVLYASGADGLLGLDLDIHHSINDPPIDFVSTAERTEGFHLVSSDTGGILRISLYGDRSVEGDGSLLEFLVRDGGLRPGAAPRVKALVNEGDISCSVESVQGLPRPGKRQR